MWKCPEPPVLLRVKRFAINQEALADRWSASVSAITKLLLIQQRLKPINALDTARRDALQTQRDGKLTGVPSFTSVPSASEASRAGVAFARTWQLYETLAQPRHDTAPGFSGRFLASAARKAHIPSFPRSADAGEKFLRRDRFRPVPNGTHTRPLETVSQLPLRNADASICT
ncbi:hypothetical protein ROHU_031194 [Labeo rohita]|uniref:Uncharacterized protein n=1 Tax=Labeo rohita TaxID=84645 RepID=A0A498LST5_LABRO|nr:hypothetical protein ROHU_031194 [Labeo rohita]